jgi:hypothetical protein
VVRVLIGIVVVTVIGIAVVGAGAFRGETVDGGGLAFTPDPPSRGTSIGVASAAGTSVPSEDGKGWTTTVALTVTDVQDTVVEGVRVTGKWSDGSKPSSCVTLADGTCSFTSTHGAVDRNGATWTMTSVGKRGKATAKGNTSKVTCNDPSRAKNRDAFGTTPCVAIGTL